MGRLRRAVGAHFRGRNRFKFAMWVRNVRVTGAERGRRFEFMTLPGRLLNDSTRWEYCFEPANGGTDVTECYEVLKPPPPLDYGAGSGGGPPRGPDGRNAAH